MKISTTRDKPDKSNSVRGYAGYLMAALFWVATWQAASMVLSQEILLASPVSVLKSLGGLVGTGEFWASVLFSFGRIVSGFFVALLAGSLFAVLAYRFRFVALLLEPLITVVKSTPVASFIILCLVWIPSRNLSVFISFIMVLPVIYTNLLEGMRQMDKRLMEMAEVFSIRMEKQIRYIYFSQVLPYLMSACSLGLGLCFKAGVAAEVIGIPRGSIGEKLYNAKIYLNTPDLFAWTIVIIVVSAVFEKSFLWILAKVAAKMERL